MSLWKVCLKIERRVQFLPMSKLLSTNFIYLLQFAFRAGYIKLASALIRKILRLHQFKVPAEYYLFPIILGIRAIVMGLRLSEQILQYGPSFKQMYPLLDLEHRVGMI